MANIPFLNNAYFAAKVGIGTDSPSSNLDIEDASGVIIDINSSSGDGMFRFQDNGATKWSVGRDNTQQNFVFSNSAGLASNNVLTLAHSTGNVGIGTTSPGGKLDITYTGTGGSGTQGIGEGLNITSLTPNITFNDTSSNVNNYAVHLNQNVLTLGRYTSATSQSPDLVLVSGNVGIGTASPVSVLEVYGGSSGVNDVDRYVRFKASNGEKRFDFYIGGTGNASSLGMYTSDGTTKNVQIASGGTSYFNGGNVGIGTTSPSQKLQVDGSIKVNANGFFGPGGTVTTDGIVSIDGGSGTGGEAYLRLMRGGTSGFILNHTATAIQVRATANIPMFFYTNDTIGIKLNANSTVSFPEYAAGYLKTDASGNITADNTGGGLPGGPSYR